jgi:hypothetical protein
MASQAVQIIGDSTGVFVNRVRYGLGALSAVADTATQDVIFIEENSVRILKAKFNQIFNASKTTYGQDRASTITALTAVFGTAPSGGLTSVSGVAPISTTGTTAVSVGIATVTQSGRGVMTSTMLGKLNGIETGADVTDATNVAAAGALMDSEVTNLAQVKAFDSSDYATAAQGALADSAQQPPSEGAFVNGDKTKLDGIAAGAEVNVVTTNLGSADQTLGGTRTIQLNGNDLIFKQSTTSKLNYDVSANQGNGQWNFAARVVFADIVSFQGNGGTTQSQIKFLEPPMGGSSGVVIKGPSTNLSSDLVFVLPDADGSAGQFLKTDGSGNLSFATASGGGGGGPSIIGRCGGRFQWSSTDSGERVGLNSTYGPFFYSHSTEPATAGRTYSASDAINSATFSEGAYLPAMTGFPVLGTSKKVKVNYALRTQSIPAGDTVGLSVWSADLGSTPNQSNVTHTLRGKSSDLTTGSSSIQVHHGSFTTTSAISDSHIRLFAEHRSGTLTTTSYMYFAVTLELVD